MRRWDLLRLKNDFNNTHGWNRPWVFYCESNPVKPACKRTVNYEQDKPVTNEENAGKKRQ
jgi:hypothetical protein